MSHAAPRLISLTCASGSASARAAPAPPAASDFRMTSSAASRSPCRRSHSSKSSASAGRRPSGRPLRVHDVRRALQHLRAQPSTTAARSRLRLRLAPLALRVGRRVGGGGGGGGGEEGGEHVYRQRPPRRRKVEVEPIAQRPIELRAQRVENQIHLVDDGERRAPHAEERHSPRSLRVERPLVDEAVAAAARRRRRPLAAQQRRTRRVAAETSPDRLREYCPASNR